MSKEKKRPGIFTTGSRKEIDLKAQINFPASANLPPEVKDEYAKNIIAFEAAWENAEEITILERIGNPVFLPFESLTAGAIGPEIERFIDLLFANSIELHFCQGPYPDEIIYRFITEEFLLYKLQDVRLDGMMTGFIYEEFHPNNEADISRLVKDFFKGWFDGVIKDQTFLFHRMIREKQGTLLAIEELIKKLNIFFFAFKRFEKCDHSVLKTAWQLHIPPAEDEGDEGSGSVEGWMIYDGIIDHGEFIHFEGNYRLELVRRYGSWLIDSIVVPGFNNEATYGSG